MHFLHGRFPPSRSQFFMFLLLLWLGLLCASYLMARDVSPNKVVIKYTTVEKLKESSQVALPINSATEAIRYAIDLEWVQSDMQDMDRRFDEKGIDWNVSSQLITNNNLSLWKVEFESPYKIPTPVCVLTFTASGELVGERKDNSCGYDSNK